MKLHHLMLFLHLLAVVLWVGGMLFAHFCLRPASQQLAPAQRLSLWAGVFGRFFPLVWGALVAILGSGVYMMLEVGFDHAPIAWHLMFLTGLVMGAVFVSIWLQLWPGLRQAVAREDWAAGAGVLARIRQRVAFNLALGVVTIALATLGLAF